MGFCSSLVPRPTSLSNAICSSMAASCDSTDKWEWGCAALCTLRLTLCALRSARCDFPEAFFLILDIFDIIYLSFTGDVVSGVLRVAGCFTRNSPLVTHHSFLLNCQTLPHRHGSRAILPEHFYRFSRLSFQLYRMYRQFARLADRRTCPTNSTAANS